MDERKRKLAGVLAQCAAAVLFGFSFMGVKLGVADVSALTLLAWRFVIAVACMGVCVLSGVCRLDLKGKRIAPLLLLSLFQPLIYFASETYGIALTTASESGTVMACIPIVTLLLAGPMLNERPTGLQKTGIAVSVLGVVLISFVKGISASFSVLGYGLLIIAMLSDSFFTIFSRKADGFSSFEKTFVMACCGAAVFTVCALIEHGRAGTLTELFTLPFNNTGFLWCILFLAAGCQFLGFLFCNFGIARLGAARASSFCGLSTVVSVLAGVLILKEEFSLMQGIGTALVLVGVYCANMQNARYAESAGETEKE